MRHRPGSSEHNGLFAEERQRATCETLARHGKVTVDDLVEMFRVSAATIRSDLARLEEKGLLRRTHGGAITASPTLFEPPYSQRLIMRHEEKRSIARGAAERVKEGETILLDAGTTLYELALLLKDRKSLTVVTNSLANAHALMDSPGIEVILIGGALQPKRRAVLGPLAARFLDAFHVDRAFLAFNGVHHEAGLTVIDFDAAELKRRMMECASESVVLCDSGKIGQVAFAKAAPLGSASLLITDAGVAPDHLAALRERGLQVLVIQQAAG